MTGIQTMQFLPTKFDIRGWKPRMRVACPQRAVGTLTSQLGMPCGIPLVTRIKGGIAAFSPQNGVNRVEKTAALADT
jgi:hypothetical protein